MVYLVVVRRYLLNLVNERVCVSLVWVYVVSVFRRVGVEFFVGGMGKSFVYFRRYISKLFCRGKG